MAERVVFTREDVIQIIDIILESPDVIMDAISNENTHWDGQSLLELIEPELDDTP